MEKNEQVNEKQGGLKSKEKLMKILSFDKIRKIPKYRNFKMAQYLILIDKLELLAILLLESYIFIQNDTT